VLVADCLLPDEERDDVGRASAAALTSALGGPEPWCFTPSRAEMADRMASTDRHLSGQVDEVDAVPAGFRDRGGMLHPMRLVNMVQARK
jgi:hypothetical protein